MCLWPVEVPCIDPGVLEKCYKALSDHSKGRQACSWIGTGLSMDPGKFALAELRQYWDLGGMRGAWRRWEEGLWGGQSGWSWRAFPGVSERGAGDSPRAVQTSTVCSDCTHWHTYMQPHWDCCSVIQGKGQSFPLPQADAGGDQSLCWNRNSLPSPVQIRIVLKENQILVISQKLIV